MTNVSGTVERLIADVDRVGYAVMSQWEPDTTTERIASTLGSIVDIAAMLPGSGIPTVQQLRPRSQVDSSVHQYSGVFGLDAFPLHTDLAHWSVPPRYFMLRCIHGAASAATYVLPTVALERLVGETTLRRALVRPRQSARNGVLALLPLSFAIGDQRGVRWDPLFLTPMNDQSRTVAEVLRSEDWHNHGLVDSRLAQPGDTLVIDNWKCLHGRSAIAAADTSRRIDRVYLSHLLR